PLAKESAKVTHLLRRATFGATDTELDRALSEGFARTVERLIETPFVEPPVFPAPAAPRPSASPSVSPRASASARPSASATARPSSLAAATTAPTQTPTPTAMATARPTTTAAPSMGAAAASASPTVPAVMTNANYARELLELFTMGVGSYTEDDVKAAAKALAGWRLPMRTEPTAQTGIFDPRRAFAAPVTFLGKTGTFNTESVVDTILANDATAPFMVRQFVTSFVTPSPSDAYVALLVDRFRRSRYDTKTLMLDIFTSPHFVLP